MSSAANNNVEGEDNPKGHEYSPALPKKRTYFSWVSMMGRCYNPASPSYPRYGGKGITVCDKWRTFEGFVADMGMRPEGLTLDRIDSSGNYEPGNCRWATIYQQNRNRSISRPLTAFGKRQTIAAWAEELNIDHATIWSRLSYGFTPEEALVPGRAKHKFNRTRPPRSINGISKGSRVKLSDTGIEHGRLSTRKSRWGHEIRTPNTLGAVKSVTDNGIRVLWDGHKSQSRNTYRPEDLMTAYCEGSGE